MRNTTWSFTILLLAVAGMFGLSGRALRGAAANTEDLSRSAAEVPNFALIDHHGQLHELRRLGGKAVVLFFTANDCPVAGQSASKIRALRDKFAEQGVTVFMVNSSMADDLDSIAK